MLKCCNCTTTSPNKVLNAWWILKVVYGGFFIAAGADKFFNLITLWSKYVSPLALQYIPLDLGLFIQGVGVLEVLIGVMIVGCCTRLGAHLGAIWLLIVAANLLSMGYPYDIAVRDIVLAVGLCVLGCLSASKSDIALVGHDHNN